MSSVNVQQRMNGSTDALRRQTWTALTWTATLVPPLVILWLIRGLAVNVPFTDDWDTMSTFAHWRDGTLAVSDLWEQHSEHRIVILRILVWLVGIASDFNVVVEMFVGFAFAVVTFVLVRRLLNRSLCVHDPSLLARK